jgi:hypothetical protein
MLSRTTYSLALMLAAVWILTGCSRSNGFSSELTSHLARQGIKIAPVRVHAPSSSRGGYAVVRYTPQAATNIVATFKLERVQPDDRQWRWAIERAGGVAGVKELWGITGRPAQFKLKNGGQFEYFFLLITENGLMYLVAEYAYG